MELRSAILWIHALAGAAWVAACVCVVIAGLALAAGSEEQRNFALSAVPKIDGFSLAAAIAVLFTGATNLAAAGLVRNFHFTPQFGLILGIKVILFTVMTVALISTLRAATSLRHSAEAASEQTITDATARMVRMHGAIAAMGGIALLLGLWLMGS